MYSCLSHFGLYINICMTRVKSKSKQLWYKKPRIWYDITRCWKAYVMGIFKHISICICVYLSLVWHSPNATKVSIMTIRFAQCFNLAEHRIDIDLRNAFLGCYSSDWYLISWFQNSPQCCATFVYFQISVPCWLHIKASTFQAPGVVDRAKPLSR